MGIVVIIFVIIYFVFLYMGVLSVEKFGYLDNGGVVLVKVFNYYFGEYGGVLLGLMIIVVCLIISVGFIIVCFFYFYKLLLFIFYKKIVISLFIFSVIIVNVGLN